VRRNALALPLSLCAALTVGAGLLQADVKLPALISDHMLLQRDRPVRIWGTATAGENVRVEIAGQSATTRADGYGRWAMMLKPLAQGGPLQLVVQGNNRIEVQDVLVGEVWVGSGQSNMQWPVSRAQNAQAEISAANFPQIRLFYVTRKVADVPADDVEGKWTLCTPETVPEFSAVLYFFGRELHQNLHVPMGLIHSSWGGTPAQAWTPLPALAGDAALAPVLEDWAKALAAYPAGMLEFNKRTASFKDDQAKAKAEGRTIYPPGKPRGPGHPHQPAGLYNAMIAPLTPYAIRGAIWYQGESNASAQFSYSYRRLFRLMIEEWRHAWGQGDFPFLFVQLANFQSNGWWPILRESQTESLQTRNTGMAVTTDIGNPTNIHPTNKQEVGRRLALWARANTYGQQITCSGPLYRQYAVENGSVRLWFDYVGRGLAPMNGDILTGFIIAGADGKFVPADARVDGDTVVVTSAAVREPAAVRYAWEDSPEANLGNRDGLPASSFRTDGWDFAPQVKK
jgi:sialate O-acetylesterase